MLGTWLADLGHEEEAVAKLRAAVRLAPEEGHEKFMTLGHLLTGPEAHALQRRGIELLEGSCRRVRPPRRPPASRRCRPPAANA